MFEDIFYRKRPSFSALSAYGFLKNGGSYCYSTEILGGAFSLTVSVTEDGAFDTALTDIATGESYVLYKTPAQGVFVGEVRAAVSAVLSDIAAHCCEPSVFKCRQTARVIDYVRGRYGDELEFLWSKFPDNAVWRRKDTQKWYGAVLTAPGEKFGLASGTKAEIIDLRVRPEAMQEQLEKPRCFPGWHMNKRSWISVVLDGGMSDSELFLLIDESHALAVK